MSSCNKESRTGREEVEHLQQQTKATEASQATDIAAVAALKNKEHNEIKAFFIQDEVDLNSIITNSVLKLPFLSGKADWQHHQFFQRSLFPKALFLEGP